MNKSEQARVDALADAETLRLEWRQRVSEYAGVPERFYVENAVTAHLWQAGMLGGYIQHECYDSAVSAARAAFRAVPGLREQ